MICIKCFCWENVLCISGQQIQNNFSSNDIKRQRKSSKDSKRHQKTSKYIERHRKTLKGIKRHQKTSTDIKIQQKTSKDIERNQNAHQCLLYNSFKISCCTIRRKQRKQRFFTPSLQSRHFALSFFVWDTTNSQSFLDRRYGKAFKMSSFLSFTTLAWKEKASSNFCKGSKLRKHGSSHQNVQKREAISRLLLQLWMCTKTGAQSDTIPRIWSLADVLWCVFLVPV